MLELILVANYKPEGAYVPLDSITRLVDASYLPFLDMLDETRWPVVHCFNGSVLHQLSKNHAYWIEKLHYLNKAGCAELCTKGFSDAFLSQLPESDIREQLMASHEIEIQVWSKPGPGFLAAEGMLDPLAATMLQENGIQWAILSSRLFPSTINADAKHHVLSISGIQKDQYLPVISIWDDAQLMDQLIDVFLGKLDAKTLVNYIFKQTKQMEQPIVALSLPMELPLFVEDPTPIFQRFRFFLQCLERATPIEIIPVARALEKLQEVGKRRVMMYQEALYLRRLNYMLETTRHAIYQAMQKNPKSPLLISAQKELLLAEDCEAIQVFQAPTSKESGFFSVFARYTQACERARLAYRQAIEAMAAPITEL